MVLGFLDSLDSLDLRPPKNGGVTLTRQPTMPDTRVFNAPYAPWHLPPCKHPSHLPTSRRPAAHASRANPLASTWRRPPVAPGLSPRLAAPAKAVLRRAQAPLAPRAEAKPRVVKTPLMGTTDSSTLRWMVEIEIQKFTTGLRNPTE